MGPDISTHELAERIHTRGKTIKMTEWLEECCVALGICGSGIMVLGNIVYWVVWVESGVWGLTMARFNTGWVAPVVSFLTMFVMAGTTRYLQNCQKADRVLYNALKGTLIPDKEKEKK